MILALVAAQALHPVFHWPEPAAQVVSIQAVVKLPPLDARQRAAAQILAETITDQVEGYSRAEMRDTIAQSGDRLRVWIMPDHLRIQLGVMPRDLKPALSYLDQILRKSQLPAESVSNAISESSFRLRSIWDTAIQPELLDFRAIRRDDVVDVYKRICRPDHVWLAIGGAHLAADADSYWESKNSDWKSSRIASGLGTELPRLKSIPGSETIIELHGKEFSGTDAALPTRILAIIALGSGKGSAVFERWRDRKAWSYRQEGLLWPTPNGFAPRFIMATGDSTPPDELGKQMKAELEDAVGQWLDADLDRARGMAEGILLRGFEMNPFYFNPGWPVLTSLQDETFLAAYWPMKTGEEWNPKHLLGQMVLVSLADLKQAAIEMLAGCEVRVLPAEK